MLHTADEGDIHFNLYAPEGLYRSSGLAEDEIAHLVTLDVKPASYFAAGNVTNQHGHGGALFCRDPQIMGWLFED